MMDPFLSALSESNDLPDRQSLFNAAIVAVFAYLVPLLTMEINFFRLAAYKSWRRRRGRRRETKGRPGRRASNAAVVAGGGAAKAADEDDDENEEGGDVVKNGGEEKKEEEKEDDDARRPTVVVANAGPNRGSSAPPLDDESRSSSSDDGSAVGHLLADVSGRDIDPSLQRAYYSIRAASMQAIFLSLFVYSLTAVGISLNTRGLDPKVIAIIVGCSQFLAALMVFIVSAKVPQWIGVYHQGHIRLVKCSSNYSQLFENIDLDDDACLGRLKSNVRLGVWFHFSKFYIVLTPFYCGVRPGTIPLSIAAGVLVGFVLMWAVFVVHEKYTHRRNAVSFLTIFFLSIISALTFTRGMAWIQVVWKLDILRSEDTLMVISFFTWLVLCAAVHTLFIWHTLRVEEGKCKGSDGEGGAAVTDDDRNNDYGGRDSSGLNAPNRKGMRRTSSYGSYSSFVFDPRTHFKDGKCQFADHPDVEDDFTHELTSEADLPIAIDCDGGGEEVGEGSGFFIEAPEANENSNGVEVDFDDDEITDDGASSPDLDEVEDLNPAIPGKGVSPSSLSVDGDASLEKEKRRRRPAWCEVFVCFTPEYRRSSCLWKLICWIKIVVLTLAYLASLYFVIVCIGATRQINSTKAGLPAVREALYSRMNEGPVCAFDNRGPDSDIATFEDREAAHEAGYLVVHCGACGACSSWENLVVEYTTKDNMAALANECAKKSLFGGGDDAVTACLMKPDIGFKEECAVCWMEDILCTKDHCAFIFLQSQMINNVGNFAVGEDEITSASCEEAHCEVGQFVPCSGATRRRMNIVSSISRPGDQQCGIVDVESWEDLFFGSGVA